MYLVPAIEQAENVVPVRHITLPLGVVNLGIEQELAPGAGGQYSIFPPKPISQLSMDCKLSRDAAVVSSERQDFDRLRLGHVGLGFFTCPEPVHVVRPYLHHKSSFRQEGHPVVGPSVRVPHHVGQLMFDEVGPEVQDFIQNSSRHVQGAVHRHPVRLGREAFLSQRTSIDGR